jgi:hypothetical protein
MGSLTVNTDDPSELRAARAYIDVRLKALDGTADTEPDSESAAYDLVKVLWPRIGTKSRGHVKAMARVGERKDEFDLQDLAGEVGGSYETVRRWRYGFGRSLKKLAADHPGAPALFDSYWAGDRQVYRMRPEVRKVVLEQDD